MEGHGAYNRHAGSQAAGAALALNALRQTAAGVVLDTGDQPLVIAEYGASQGRNSQLPVRVAITELRARVGPVRSGLSRRSGHQRFLLAFRGAGGGPGPICPRRPERVPLCNPVVLRERGAARLRASRLERVR